MFGIGWTEFAVISAVAIMVVGPEDMPGLLHKTGKLIRKIKLFTQDVHSSIDGIVREVEVDELANEINKKVGGDNLQFEIDKQIALESRSEKKDEE